MFFARDRAIYCQVTVLEEQFLSAIKSQLAERGWSARAAAQRAGVPTRSFQNVLDGKSPSLNRAAQICAAFGLDLTLSPAAKPLPADSESHHWGDRRGKILTPFPIPMREGHAPERVGFSPNGCASYGLEFLLEWDLNPEACEVIEIFDDSMAPEFPAGAAGLVDLRKTRRADGLVFVLEAPELTVRRTIRTSSGWAAVADNPEFESIPWARSFGVVGQVVWTSHMVGVAPLKRRAGSKGVIPPAG